MAEDVPMSQVDEGIAKNWKRVPSQIARTNEGDGLNIARNMLGLEATNRYVDSGNSPIFALQYNFTNIPTHPTCVDCENERRQQSEL